MTYIVLEQGLVWLTFDIDMMGMTLRPLTYLSETIPNRFLFKNLDIKHVPCMCVFENMTYPKKFQNLNYCWINRIMPSFRLTIIDIIYCCNTKIRKD